MTSINNLVAPLSEYMSNERIISNGPLGNLLINKLSEKVGRFPNSKQSHVGHVLKVTSSKPSFSQGSGLKLILGEPKVCPKQVLFKCLLS